MFRSQMSLKLQFYKKKISPAPAATNYHSISISFTRKPQLQSRCENSDLGRGSRTTVSHSQNQKLLELKITPRTCLDTSSSQPPLWWLFTLFLFFLTKFCLWGWVSPCIPKFDNRLFATTQWVFSLEPFLCSLEALGRAQFVVVGK